MTAAASTGTTAMSEHAARSPELEIGSMTIRGRGFPPAAGQSLAVAVAGALAGQLAGGTARIGGMTIRIPASVLDARGGIDHAALGRAVARAEREPDA